MRVCTGGTSVGCYSVRYPALGLSFTHVCGQVLGYMYSSVDGLDAVATTKVIDNPYVDGLSITYGSPRQHLWTYAAGHNGRCLCHSPTHASSSSSFVGQHFYCDGWPEQYSAIWYTQSPYGTVKVVLPATPASTHQTCRGSTGHSTQPALMTLKCVGAVMKMLVMKTLEWFCLNSVCTELSKLSKYCQC